jgi:hypothetical protein
VEEEAGGGQEEDREEEEGAMAGHRGAHARAKRRRRARGDGGGVAAALKARDKRVRVFVRFERAREVKCEGFQVLDRSMGLESRLARTEPRRARIGHSKKKLVHQQIGQKRELANAAQGRKSRVQLKGERRASI